MLIKFNKYSAHGNDFIILDNRKGEFSGDLSPLFESLCQRRLSLGADGVILMDVQADELNLTFYNSDGKFTKMCGNGSRAAVELAIKEDMHFRGDHFLVNGVRHSSRIADDGSVGVELFLNSSKILKQVVEISNRQIKCYFLDTGVPHTFVIDSDSADIATKELVFELRRQINFAPSGTNVSFVQLNSADHADILTFERGVEDFTYSCGTAAAALGFIMTHELGYKLPCYIRSKGGTLKITLGETPQSIWIWGSVRHIATGTIVQGTILNS